MLIRVDSGAVPVLSAALAAVIASDAQAPPCLRFLDPELTVGTVPNLLVVSIVTVPLTPAPTAVTLASGMIDPAVGTSGPSPQIACCASAPATTSSCSPSTSRRSTFSQINFDPDCEIITNCFWSGARHSARTTISPKCFPPVPVYSTR